MSAAELSHVSILGTGKMGSAVGCKLASTGLQVTYGSRDPQQSKQKFSDLHNVEVTDYGSACEAADVVLIAVPWRVTLETVREHRGQLGEKTVIDLTNPTSPDWSHLVTAGDESAAEQISGVLGSSRLVKLFNGITADNFPDPRFSGEPAQAFFCGGGPEDKAIAAELVSRSGYRPVDCGSLENARYLEPMAMLWVQLAFWEEWGTNFSFKVVGEVPQPEGRGS